MSRSTAERASARSTVVEERRLIGRLVTLGSGPDVRAELRQDGRTYALPPDAAATAQVTAASGEWVVVRALCRVVRNEDREDDILELQRIVDLTPFDFAPLVVRRLTVGSTVLCFATPIEVEPRPVDNLVALDYPPLGILTGGETRAEAEAEFLDELAWLWETYAQADEATLAEGAARLRATLRGMVEEEAS